MLSRLTDGDDYYCEPCGKSFDLQGVTSGGTWQCPLCGNEELEGPHERPRLPSMEATLGKMQALEARIIDLEAHKDALHERVYTLERFDQKQESNIDYMNRIIDDLKRDIDVGR
jgi:ribosomal protein L37AE/L43A